MKIISVKRSKSGKLYFLGACEDGGGIKQLLKLIDFTVEFWYGTDLRLHRDIQAANMTAALVLACDSNEELWNWTDYGQEFYVKIKRIS